MVIRYNLENRSRSNNETSTATDSQDTEMITDPVLLTTSRARQNEAKQKELQQWEEMGVYKEVPDSGQECISLRWVIREKVGDKGEVNCKARLYVRDFEEEQNFRTNSPTCSREWMHMFLATAELKR